MAFAVDISGSTKGTTLKQELSAVEEVYYGLSTQWAKDELRILPWSHIASDPMSFTKDLKSDSGGTDPAVIANTSSHRAVLHESYMWFLFTDGEINASEVSNFRDGICREGLHGKACIIVVFGKSSNSPANCNISVGQVVLARTPNSCFLFHDIKKRRLYLLQAKGIFKALLNDRKDISDLNSKTRWKDLPQITYRDLLNIGIPTPRTLKTDDIVLHSEEVITATAVYEDALPKSTVDSVFRNEDDLKSILLDAHSCGRETEFKAWTVKQREMPYSPRPDTSKAEGFITQLQGTNHHSECTARIQERLRQAHTRNMQQFLGKVDEATLERDRTVALVLDRIKVAKAHPNSARLMTPIIQSRSHQPKTKLPKVIHTRGFQIDSATKRYDGSCHFCGNENVLLSLLLDNISHRENDAGSKITILSNSEDSTSHIISSQICCEACATVLVNSGYHTAAYPLLLNDDGLNEKAHVEALRLVWGSSYSNYGVKSEFRHVLKDKYDILREENREDNRALLEAIEWLLDGMPRVTQQDVLDNLEDGNHDNAIVLSQSQSPWTALQDLSLANYTLNPSYDTSIPAERSSDYPSDTGNLTIAPNIYNQIPRSQDNSAVQADAPQDLTPAPDSGNASFQSWNYSAMGNDYGLSTTYRSSFVAGGSAYKKSSFPEHPKEGKARVEEIE